MFFGVAAENRHCSIPLTSEPQHLVDGVASRVIPTDTLGCGSSARPWSVEAFAGQRIAVSLITFISSGSSFDNNNNNNNTLYLLVCVFMIDSVFHNKTEVSSKM